MSYSFPCAECGHQETPHIEGARNSQEDQRLRGYKYSLENCPGFCYRKCDESAVIDEFIADPIKDFPKYLQERAEARKSKERKRRGLPEDEPVNHAVWAIINGRVVDIGS